MTDVVPERASTGLRIIRARPVTLDELRARYPGAIDIRFEGSSMIIEWARQVAE